MVSSDGFLRGDFLGEPLDSFDVVIPRVGRSLTDVGYLLLQHLAVLGVPTTLQALALLNSRDKFLSYQLLAAKKIPVPQTTLVLNGLLLPETISAFQFPVVIKVHDSTHGIGCVQAPTPQVAREVVEALLQRGEGKILVQQYLRPRSRSLHEDIRAFVIDGEVIGAMRRISSKGEWRTNYALGAQIVPHQLQSEEEEVAIKTSEALGLEIAGIDIINTGIPRVLEANSCPGWRGIQQATGINVAQKIVEYAIKKVRT